MSHLVCPLCGKNAPLSTLNPSSYELDLRVVSFIGLGRGKGFSKSGEYSILNDGEYSPMIAERVLDLCSMFLQSGELNKEVIIEKLGLSLTNEEDRASQELIEKLNAGLEAEKNLNKKYYDAGQMLLDENEQLKKKNASLENELLVNRIKLEEYTSEETIEKKVDYILREGCSLQETRIIETDKSGWWVNISEDTPEFILFLFMLVPSLPFDIKLELFKRVKSDDEKTDLALENIRNLHIKSISEMIYDSNLPSTLPDGTAIKFSSYKYNLTMESLKTLVVYNKNSILRMKA